MCVRLSVRLNVRLDVRLSVSECEVNVSVRV